MRTLAVCLLTVLTHEAVIDSAWDQSVSPLIRKRFPQVTAEEL